MCRKVHRSKVIIMFRDAYCWQGFSLAEFFKQFQVSSIARIEIAFAHIVGMAWHTKQPNYQEFSAEKIAYLCGPAHNVKNSRHA